MAQKDQRRNKKAWRARGSYSATLAGWRWLATASGGGDDHHPRYSSRPFFTHLDFYLRTLFQGFSGGS